MNTSKPKIKSQKCSSRRGSAYLSVLGTTLMVSILAIGSLVSIRAQYRAAKGSGDASEAQLLALSGIQMGHLAIAQNSNWRNTYSTPDWQPELSLGNGKFVTWKVVDAETGGSVLHAGVNTLADISGARIVGKGRVGDAVQMRSVGQTSTKESYTAMLSALHANGNISFPAGSSRSFTVSGAPLSTNGSFTNAITFNGNVEATTISNTGTISGTQTPGATAKAMPPDSVWDLYRPMATTIPWNTTYFISGGSGKWIPKTNILTPTMSQFSIPVTNPDGVYYVSVPGGLGKVQFDWVRVNGTILWDVQGSGTTIHFGGHILWTPARPDFPMTIIRNAQTVELDAQGNYGPLTEGGTNNSAGNANFNPPGFPFNSVTDTDTSDSYESRLHGIIHIMGGVGGVPTSTTIFTQLTLTGCIITPGPVTFPGGSATPIAASLTWDPALLSNPPLGYYVQRQQQSSGSWKQEVLP